MRRLCQSEKTHPTLNSQDRGQAAFTITYFLLLISCERRSPAIRASGGGLAEPGGPRGPWRCPRGRSLPAPQPQTRRGAGGSGRLLPVPQAAPRPRRAPQPAAPPPTPGARPGPARPPLPSPHLSRAPPQAAAPPARPRPSPQRRRRLRGARARPPPPRPRAAALRTRQWARGPGPNGRREAAP